MAKKEKKENKQKIWIFVLVIVAIIFILLNFKPTTTEPGSVSNKGVALQVFGWKDGVKIGELTQAVQTFSTLQYNPAGGGSIMSGVDAISIRHTVSQGPLSDVDVNVNTIIGSFGTDGSGNLPSIGDLRYNTALAGVMRTFVLPLGGPSKVEESAAFNILDLEDDCNNVPYCVFKLQLDANFNDIDPDTGQMIMTQIALENSFGSIILKVSADVCTDQTPWGQCSIVGGGGKFCDDEIDLINCAAPSGCNPTNYGHTSCPCTAGYVDVSGVCTEQLCVGGLHPGKCTGTNANMCDPGCLVANCQTVQKCDQCGQAGQEQGIPLGWASIVLNKAECPNAYNGDPADSCTQSTGKCKYKGKKGVVTVTLE